MVSHTTILVSVAAMATFTFLIIQSYVIGNRNNNIDRILLGSLIPSVLLGHTFAFFAGRSKERAVLLKVLAFTSAIAFLITQTYTLTRIDQQSHRTMLGSVYPPVLAGHILAYVAGKSFHY